MLDLIIPVPAGIQDSGPRRPPRAAGARIVPRTIQKKLITRMMPMLAMVEDFLLLRFTMTLSYSFDRSGRGF